MISLAHIRSRASRPAYIAYPPPSEKMLPRPAGALPLDRSIADLLSLSLPSMTAFDEEAMRRRSSRHAHSAAYSGRPV